MLKIIHGSPNPETNKPQTLEIRNVLWYVYGFSVLCAVTIVMITINLLLF